MDINFAFEFFSWTAIFIVSIAYWLQVIKIHKHKEVRDLSLYSYSVLTLGYFMLLIESVCHFNLIIFAKSLAVFVPCLLIVFLIQHNKHCEWVDEDNFKCINCGKVLQPYHLFCSSCGKSTIRKKI
jgi:uncharacterized protein with PQ loop repeat